MVIFLILMVAIILIHLNCEQKITGQPGNIGT